MSLAFDSGKDVVEDLNEGIGGAMYSIRHYGVQMVFDPTAGFDHRGQSGN